MDLDLGNITSKIERDIDKVATLGGALIQFSALAKQTGQTLLKTIEDEMQGALEHLDIGTGLERGVDWAILGKAPREKKVRDLAIKAYLGGYLIKELGLSSRYGNLLMRAGVGVGVGNFLAVIVMNMGSPPNSLGSYQGGSPSYGY